MDLTSAYVATTERLLTTLSISHPTGHLVGGLLLFLAVHAMLGMRGAAILPFLAVAAAEAMNETIQAAFYGSWRLTDTIPDIGMTLLLPFMLFVVTLVRVNGPAVPARRAALLLR